MHPNRLNINFHHSPIVALLIEMPVHPEHIEHTHGSKMFSGIECNHIFSGHRTSSTFFRFLFFD
jgi:hypothetical protein